MFSLDDLAKIIAVRAGASAEKSYTRSLLEKGPRGAAKKFGELWREHDINLGQVAGSLSAKLRVSRIGAFNI